MEILLSTLVPGHREIIEYRYKRKMTFNQIAAEWGRTVNRVRNQHDRAIRQLKNSERIYYLKHGKMNEEPATGGDIIVRQAIRDRELKYGNDCDH